MNLIFRLSTQVKDTESASETILLNDSLNNCMANKNTMKKTINTKSTDTTENFDTFIEKMN